MGRALTRKRIPNPGSGCPRHPDDGFTLIEVSLAMLILLVGVTAMLGAVALGVGVNKAEGEVASRVTTAAQAKLEELRALEFDDTSTDTALAPPAATGGAGLAAGGSIDAASPAAGYVDYLDEAGARTTADRAFFTRLWEITDDASGNAKTIEVLVFSRRVATQGAPPSTTLVGIVANN